MSVPHLVIIYTEEFKMTDEQKMEQDPLSLFLIGAQSHSGHLLKRVINWFLMKEHPCYSVLTGFSSH